MKITIGSDHRGFDLKSQIIEHFKDIKWLDVGTNSKERTDYPIFAKKVCNNILKKEADLGILLCGSGVGVGIAANRFKGIYAAVCWNAQVAQSAKADDNANVLVLPANFISKEEALAIIKAWLGAEFKGGHYQKRLEMVEEC
jgi:ribose 5-phosphate isomerase B